MTASGTFNALSHLDEAQASAVAAFINSAPIEGVDETQASAIRTAAEEALLVERLVTMAHLHFPQATLIILHASEEGSWVVYSLIDSTGYSIGASYKLNCTNEAATLLKRLHTLSQSAPVRVLDCSADRELLVGGDESTQAAATLLNDGVYSLRGALTRETIDFSDIERVLTERELAYDTKVLACACDLVGIGSADDDTPQGYRDERLRRFVQDAFNLREPNPGMRHISDEDAASLTAMALRLRAQYVEWNQYATA